MGLSMLFTELHIGAFRGVRDVRLTGLGAVNLIVGENNSGKTSVLEAASLLVRPVDALQWTRVLQCRDIDQRRLSPERVWGMFPASEGLSFLQGPQRSRSIVIEGTINNGCRRMEATAIVQETGDVLGDQSSVLRVSVGIVLTPEDRTETVHWNMHVTSGSELQPDWIDNHSVMKYRAVPLAPNTRNSSARLIDLYSHVIATQKKDLALSLIRLFDDQVKDIHLVQAHGEQHLLLQHATRRAVELATFGDGMRQALALALAVTRASGGLLVVDEFEAGIHHHLLGQLLRYLLLACQQADVQVFCSSHSLDAIDALLNAARQIDILPHVRGYWLQSDLTERRVQRYTGERLVSLREGGLDIR